MDEVIVPATIQSPWQKVVAALPGTLSELTQRTEYPAGQVLRFLLQARVNGIRVSARMGERTLDGWGPTIYEMEGANE